MGKRSSTRLVCPDFEIAFGRIGKGRVESRQAMPFKVVVLRSHLSQILVKKLLRVTISILVLLPLRMLLSAEVPQADLERYRQEIAPVLKAACAGCHGPKKQKGSFRIDTLDSDLLTGGDVSWWLEVFEVISNGEMPPEDADHPLKDEEKARIVDWLSGEIQLASQVRRSREAHTSFRRMTRYEYNYSMQDLLGLPFDFSRDLPPETSSEDGFKNSSEMLQMTAMQLVQYRKQARRALHSATIRGKRPDPVYYGIPMRAFTERFDPEYAASVARTLKRIREKDISLQEALQAEEKKYRGRPGGTYFRNLITGQGVKPRWSYHGAKYAWKPVSKRPEIPPAMQDVVVIAPNQKFVVDVGNGLPDEGNMRVRIRAARLLEENTDDRHHPTLRLYFGNQPSNDSRLSVNVGKDVVIDAPPGDARFYHWDVPLGEVPRNAFRDSHRLGQLPNPGEFLSLLNTSSVPASLTVDYLEIIAPALEQWPPESHTRIFPPRDEDIEEEVYAREVLTGFMERAWRRPVTEAEVSQKLLLYDRLRPGCIDFQEAMVEVMASVLSSPKYLYLGRIAGEGEDGRRITDLELASRLSFFLWSSLPDEELLTAAATGSLSKGAVLEQQTRRMLTDPKVQRFAQHYTRQWLGMEELDFLKFDTKVHGRIDPLLVESMKREPVAFFSEVLGQNRSIFEFLDSDYALLNDRLARHYGLPEVLGHQLRKVALSPDDRRGGLLAQAGLLAMNSNGKDSNPLKRGIWILENLLNDPPPPPPPTVPEIDLADPDILKLTLKQRMEDHRDDPACASCHSKIDPWGIAFENFDALGRWRDTVRGAPVDASSMLFNKEELHGIKGVKDYLLNNRQKQFSRAMTHKLASYALGRPITFSDRSEVDRISTELREEGGGLRDLILLIVKSDLFQLD